MGTQYLINKRESIMESHIAVFGKSANENEWGMYVAYSIDQLGVEKAVQ